MLPHTGLIRIDRSTVLKRNLNILRAGDLQALHRRHKTLQLIHNILMHRPDLVLACANSKIQSLNHTWNMGVCPPVTYIHSVLSRQARRGLANLWHAYTQRNVERFPWHAAFTAVADQPLYIVKNMCMYTHTHIYLTAQRLYMNYSCYQITLQWDIFTQIGSGGKCWLDVYYWVAGLTATGRISDTGQHVLRSSFETGYSKSPSYFQNFLPNRVPRPGL
jgi:hypothetical protein